jgi:hypothetical protein
MTLQPPKKQATGGYYLALTSPVASPRLRWSGSEWVLTDEWATWANEHRNKLIGELLSHGNWFSRPPRRDLIEPLFPPWTSKSMQNTQQISCKPPQAPGVGASVWTLEGLTMTATSVTPNWTVSNYEAEQDTISLFGDGETVDEEEEREIQFDDIELASPAAAPTRMRNREWEAAKFLAKERVREARLKVQIAERMAAKEESRFYAKYGELDDDESHFSEYDLTEDEDEVGSESPSIP